MESTGFSTTVVPVGKPAKGSCCSLLCVQSPNRLVFVSCRQSKRGEESIDGVPTWEQQRCLIHVTESAKGRFGNVLMSLNTNC